MGEKIINQNELTPELIVYLQKLQTRVKMGSPTGDETYTVDYYLSCIKRLEQKGFRVPDKFKMNRTDDDLKEN